MYIVKFVRNDCMPDEMYYYHSKEDANYHMNMFRDDDSGLYTKIEVIKEGVSEEVIGGIYFG